MIRRLQSWGRWSLIALSCFAIALSVSGQMLPGMEDESTSKTDSSAAAALQQDVASDAGAVVRFWRTYMGDHSPYKPVILTLLTLIIVLRLRAYLTRIVKKQVTEKAFEPENAKNFMQIWNGVWKFVVAILVLIAMSGSLRMLGLTAGFLGMMLGWSLQQPVTGIAAWLMIILKKPFRIGDRVIIAGVTGDVTSISLTHVVLNQVGGTVGGEERSGRGILIPNAILFQHMIINYTLEQKYMLDEVPVRLAFDADWDLAKKLMIAAAEKVTADIIAETGAKPFLRAEFLDWGILVRLRYQTEPTNRQEISTEIIEILLHDFRAHYPRVAFAYPTSRVRYSSDAGMNADGESHAGQPPYAPDSK